MSVEGDYFEDKRKEFGRIHAIMRERGGFGRNNKTLLFMCCSNLQKSVVLPAHYMGHTVSTVLMRIISLENVRKKK